MEEQKPQKYSLVTGEKIKKPSLRKIEKKHKEKKHKEKKETKKLNRKIKRVDKKLHVEDSQPSEVESDKKTSQTKVLIVRKQDNDVPVTPKRKFLNFLSYVLVAIVAVVFGYFSGNFYVANVLNKVDYGAFSEETLKADGQAVYTRLMGNFNSGSNPVRESAADLFVATMFVTDQLENYYVEISGVISPSIGSKQDVWGYKKREGNLFSYENMSRGMLSVGEKGVYDTETKTATVNKATVVNPENSAFSDEAINYTYEEYREEYGSDPTVPYCPYIINKEKTVIEGSEAVTSLGGGRYQLDFMLTTDSSVLNYVKQVKHMSGLGGYPTFKQINVRAVIEYNSSNAGSEFRFISIRFDESYSVVYAGFMATCIGYLENTFIY